MILVFISTLVTAQGSNQNSNGEKSFHEKIAEADAYWATQIELYGSEDSLMQVTKDYKRYMNHRNYYLDKITPGETIKDAENKLKFFFQNNQIENYSNDAEWYELGPKTKGFIGPVNFLTLDASNHNRMFTGGEHGGLFYSEDAGEHWVNAGTDHLNYSISAADAQFSPDDPENTWFFMDGNGESEVVSKGGDYTNEPILLRPMRSVKTPVISGIYRTTDAGNTWQQIGNEAVLYDSLKSIGFGEESEWDMKKLLVIPHSNDDNLTLYIATSIGILRTTNALDEDVEWEKVYSIEDSPNELFIGENIDESLLTEKQVWGYKIFWVPNDYYTSSGGLFVGAITKDMRVPDDVDANAPWPWENHDIYYQSYLIYSETGDPGTWSEWKVPIPNEQAQPTFYWKDTIPTPEIRRPYRTDIAIPNKSGNINHIYLLSKTTELNSVDYSVLKWDVTTQDYEVVTEGMSADDKPNDYSCIAVNPEETVLFYSYQLRAKRTIYVDNQWQYTTLISVSANENTGLHMDLEDCLFNDNGDLFVATHGGVCINTNTQYTSFEPTDIGLGVAQVSGFSTSYSNPETIAVGLWHDNSQATVNSFYENNWVPSWEKFVGNGDEFDPDINYSDNSIIYTRGSASEQTLAHFNFPVDVDYGVTHKPRLYGANDRFSDISGTELNYFEHNSLYTNWTHEIINNNEPNPPIRAWVYRHPNQGAGYSDTRWREIFKMRDATILNPIIEEYVVENLTETADSIKIRSKAVFPSKADPNLLFVYMKVGGNNLIAITNKAQYGIEGNNNIIQGETVIEEINSSWRLIDIVNQNNDINYNGLNEIHSDPLNPNVFYVLPGAWRHEIYRYTYNGDILTDDIDVENFDVVKIKTPAIKVLSLYIMPGTRDVFIGSSMGVYHASLDEIDTYINNGESVPVETVWTRYGPNLPNAEVKEIEPNFIADKLRAGTFGRGAWEIPLPCDKLDEAYIIPTGESRTINNYARFRQDVIVEDGATLTLTSMAKVYFAEGCKLIIEPGGRVTMNGGLLSNACGTYWEGVEVRGDISLNQTTSNQGYLLMRYGATIENAECGVRLAKNNVIDGWDIDWSTTGGIVKAYDSHFLNNRKDVEFLPYENSNNNGVVRNISRFQKTDFRVNDDYFDDTYLAANITMWKVNGVQVLGCVFEDERSDIDRELRRDGILGYKASFDVKEYCSTVPENGTCNGIESEFINMGYGIKAFNLNNCVFNIKVENSIFENCWKGAYFSDVELASVIFNTFNVYHLPENIKGEFLGPVGLYLDHLCSLYEVQENDFNGDDAQNGISVGIVATNGHPDFELIYKNSFDNLRVGIETLGQNRNLTTEPLNGLTIKCNDYIDNRIDNYTSQFNPFGDPVKGVFQYQGDASNGNNEDLANNSFNSPPSADYFSSFYNSQACEGILYSFNGNITNHNPYLPNATNNLVASDHYFNEGLSNCPSKLIVKTIGEKSLEKTEAEQGIADKQAELDILVDGGNTAQLESDVVQTTNSDAWIKYQELMSNAGYLSETVLKEVSKKEDGFTDGMIRNILVANPQAAKSKEVTKELDERSNPLPIYMRDQIKLGLTSISAKEFLELQQSKYQIQYDLAITDALRILNSDTIDPNKTADIIAWMSNTNNMNWDYKLVDYYDNNDMETMGDALLAVIESDYEMSNDQATKHTRYVDFRDLMKTWQQAGVSEMHLTTSELAQLDQYKDEGGKAGTRARALLILNDAMEYEPMVVLPGEGGEKKMQQLKPESIEQGELKVSPNPSKDFFTVQYRVDKAYQNASLILLDSRGAVVNSITLSNLQDEVLINNESFAKGKYTLILIIDGSPYLQETVIIQ